MISHTLQRRYSLSQLKHLHAVRIKYWYKKFTVKYFKTLTIILVLTEWHDILNAFQGLTTQGHLSHAHELGALQEIIMIIRNIPYLIIHVILSLDRA